MKLLYYYIDEFRTLKHSELNFDSDMRFHFSDGVLTCVLNDELGNNFFSLKGSTSVVDSVSAIVGNNGSGKTSVATLLNYSFVLGRPFPRYICICEVDGKIICFSNLVNIPDDSQVKSLLGEMWEHRTKDLIKDNAGCPFEVFYFSPYLHPRMIWDDRNIWCHDISMTSNMNAAVGIATADVPPKDSSPISVLNDELNRARIRFLYSFVSAMQDESADVPIPLPGTMEVKADVSLFIEFEGYVFDQQNKVGENAASVRWLGRLKSCMNSKDALRVVLLAYTIYIAKALDFALVGVDKLPEVVDLIELCLNSETAYQIEAALNEDVWNRKCLKWKNVDAKILKAFLTDYAQLYRLRESDTMVSGFRVALDDKNKCDALLRLIAAHNKLARGGGNWFVAFDPSDMSAGECAYLNLFALLYQRLTSTISPVKSSILLFLDEVESTLHPEWQRRMVYNVIWFLENFVPSQKVHVVFATHSPMLLSDVPLGNCVFLDKEDGVTQVRPFDGVEIKGEERSNTFGANIFDMYYQSFFMKDGVIGKFAMTKILNLDKKKPEEGWRIARLVGDAFVRGMIEDSLEGVVDKAETSVPEQMFEEPAIDYPVE